MSRTGCREPLLPWLLLLALVLRSGFVLYHAQVGWHLQHDAGYYLTLARHLKHGVYSLFHPLDIPDTTRMPGYPWLIHLLGCSVPAVLAVQVLLSSAKVLLVHRLARAIGLSRQGALLAAALMALEPVDIVLTGSLLTEACFTTALLGGILLLARPGHPWRAVMAAAVCFGAAAWFRANGLPLALMGAGIAVALLRMELRMAGAFVALMLLLVAPWVLRNRVETGRLVLSDSGAVAAAHFHLPEVLAAAGDPRAAVYKQELHGRAARTDWEEPGAASAYFSGLRDDLRHTFVAHPLTWAGVQLRTTAGILLAPGRGHIAGFFGRGVVAWAITCVALLYTGLLVFALVFWVWHARRLPAVLVVVLLLAGAVLFSGGISTTDARFKSPAMPLLLVGAAWAVEQARGLLRQRTDARDRSTCHSSSTAFAPARTSPTAHCTHLVSPNAGTSNGAKPRIGPYMAEAFLAAAGGIAPSV